ncbi:MAG: riboflavin synthase [Chloroflexota bacterium]
MFTGLILELGEVVSTARKSEGARLTVTGQNTSRSAAVGDSISVNGVCLTAVTVRRDELTFDVSFETLRSTTLGALRRGDRVNLEPSLTPSSKLGGHFVTGHIDDTGRIVSKVPAGEAVRIEITASAEVLQYLVRKGSVAVDGISLTVVDVLDEGFTVVIIPHTFALTTIGIKKPGDSVNLECDILGKYVAKFLGGRGATSEKLHDHTADTQLLTALKRSGFVGP